MKGAGAVPPEVHSVLIIYRDFLGDGGVPEDARALTNALIGRGWSIDVICSAGIAESAQRRVDFNQFHSITPTRLWRLCVRRHSYVFVVGALIPWQLPFELMMMIFGKRRVQFPHGILTNPAYRYHFGGDPRALVSILIKYCGVQLTRGFLFRTSYAIRALSEHEAESFAWHPRVVVVSDGVDETWMQPTTYTPVPVVPAAVSSTKYLFLGRLEPYQKGLDFILGAVDQALDQGVEFLMEVKLVGPRTRQFDVMWEDAPARIKDVVEVLPPVVDEEKWELFRWTDFFLHPSRYEGMARAPREALGMGVPLIASRESNLGSWVTARDLGRGCHATSASLLIAMEEGARLGASDRARLREAAVAFARDHTWEKVAVQLEDGLADLDG